MSPPLSEYCMDRLRADFQGEAEAAAALLAGYGSQPHHREAERVRRDIIHLAAGSLDKMKELLNLANTDYRDLIVYAEYEPDPEKQGPWNLRKKATPWLRGAAGE